MQISFHRLYNLPRKQGYKYKQINTKQNQQRRAGTKQLSCQIQSYKYKLQDGVHLEVLKFVKNTDEKDKPPLIFLHGVGHAAWCYRENFLPYFGDLGYPSYAISFRGQGESDPVDAVASGTVQQHVDDIVDFIQSLNQIGKLRPIIIAHSLGGYVALLYVTNMDREGYPRIGGAGFLCSAPPSDKNAVVKRHLQMDFWQTIKLREEFKFLFFSNDLNEDLLERYFSQIQGYANCPRLVDQDDFQKRPPLNKPDKIPPAFVLEAVQDKIVDTQTVEETAEWLNVKPVFIEKMGHDCMLDTRWKEAAQNLSNWLQKL